MPFNKEKMPWCTCPFKEEAYRPDAIVLTANLTKA